MIIGLDFDNTIVSYTGAIETLSTSIPDLPNDISRTKVGLRDYLRKSGREAEWTAFQGRLYGPGMKYAIPFPGAVDAMIRLKDMGHQLKIISHRSRHPYAGPNYDLHQEGSTWIHKHLMSQGLFTEDYSFVFLESKNEKIKEIIASRCNFFLDDLPEVLDDSNFPVDTKAILFDPYHNYAGISNFARALSWDHFSKIVEC